MREPSKKSAGFFRGLFTGSRTGNKVRQCTPEGVLNHDESLFQNKIFKYGKNYHNNMVKNTLTTKEKILKYLIENKESQSIRDISKKLKIDYKNTFQTINKIGHLIEKNKIGNTHAIKSNLILSEEIYTIEKKRQELFLKKHPKLSLIKKDIEKINYPFFIILIFGSTIKNINNKFSDLDLCIISDNKEKKEKLIQKLNLLSMKIELHNFTTKEFLSMIEKKQPDISDEIIKNNIILYGIENYYNLISHE